MRSDTTTKTSDREATVRWREGLLPKPDALERSATIVQRIDTQYEQALIVEAKAGKRYKLNLRGKGVYRYRHKRWSYVACYHWLEIEDPAGDQGE